MRSFSCAWRILAIHSSSSISSPTYSFTNSPCKRETSNQWTGFIPCTSDTSCCKPQLSATSMFPHRREGYVWLEIVTGTFPPIRKQEVAQLSEAWSWRKLQFTFFMSLVAIRPHPLPSVLMILVSGYRRLVKLWFWHRSPAGHTCGWHSYISIRFRHSESSPQGLSLVGLQLHLGISDISAV